MKPRVNIHHLFHSSFSVETDHHFLIFDYFHDEPPVGKSRSLAYGVITPEVLRTEKSLLVFATHGHGDHFHPLIFSWEQVNPAIQYVLSFDIPLPEQKANYHVMNPYQELFIDGVRIKAYGTTDRGISFLVEVDGLTCYHAGDLNWWHWKSFSKGQLDQEEADFKREIGQITEKIDIAFSPVDPRLEEYASLGATYLAQQLRPQFLIPMHFQEHYQITREFADALQVPGVTPVVMTGRGAVTLP